MPAVFFRGYWLERPIWYAMVFFSKKSFLIWDKFWLFPYLKLSMVLTFGVCCSNWRLVANQQSCLVMNSWFLHLCNVLIISWQARGQAQEFWSAFTVMLIIMEQTVIHIVLGGMIAVATTSVMAKLVTRSAYQAGEEVTVWYVSRDLTFGALSQSDWHLISPYDITPESHSKVARIKEMILNKRSSWLSTDSPCQHLRKCIENSMENMHSDVRV